MATADRPTARAAGASEIAAACAEAEFLTLVVRADGDALAAAGILAAVCESRSTPYHVRFVRTQAAADAQFDTADDGSTILALGLESVDPIAVDAYRAAIELGATPDPVIAVAGAVAGGAVASRLDEELLRTADLDRRPGIAVPTTDPADGLAHSTLAHAPFSGDLEAASTAVDNLGEVTGRSLASLLAIAAVSASDNPSRAGVAIERALRPYDGGPFETIGGFADVFAALAREAPGLGIRLAVTGDGHDDALSIWRERAARVHDGVRHDDTTRTDGLVIVRIDADGPVEPIARLTRDYRSPEPVVLVVGEATAGVAACEQSIGTPLTTAADAADGSALARGTTGFARFDPERATTFVETFREALA